MPHQCSAQWPKRSQEPNCSSWYLHDMMLTIRHLCHTRNRGLCQTLYGIRFRRLTPLGTAVCSGASGSGEAATRRTREMDDVGDVGGLLRRAEASGCSVSESELLERSDRMDGARRGEAPGRKSLCRLKSEGRLVELSEAWCHCKVLKSFTKL
mmetsp:Transcript_49100/g.106867  ORF Transcript_49100/g.106867 Transcript_49100/m.106867 type:complete len:153 (-) Transcript_49100:1260-1718(-)